MEVNTRYVYSMKQQPSTATWLQVITNNTRQNKPSATKHFKKNNSIKQNNTTVISQQRSIMIIYLNKHTNHKQQVHGQLSPGIDPHLIPSYHRH